jgi:hypothetical protein
MRLPVEGALMNMNWAWSKQNEDPLDFQVTEIIGR